MITNPILEEKNRVQEELAATAGDDIHKYSELVHRLFLELQQQSSLKFHYADRTGGFIQPPVPQDFSSPPTLVKA